MSIYIPNVKNAKKVCIKMAENPCEMAFGQSASEGVSIWKIN